MNAFTKLLKEWKNFMEDKKRVIILRGVSGSGKSTMARELSGETGIIHSTDDYFMQGDKYIFDPKNLHRNHQANLRAFRNSLSQGLSPVIVDNTNTRKWEYENYIKEAEKAGYEVEVISVPHPDPKVAAERNSHGVPEDMIRKMIKRWEY